VGCGRFRAGYPTFEGSRRAIASEVHPPSEADGGVSRPVTRRNFIVWYLAGLLTATVVAIVAPILVFIWPPETATKKKDVTVALDKPLSDLANGEAVKFEAPKETGFVMKDGGGDNAPGKIAFAGHAAKDLAGKVNVLAINCSHLGCSVAFTAGAKRFDCPCHGSQFNIDGDVIHGPAAYPLSHLDWKEGSKPNEIVISSVTLAGVG
jgi:Rieske Fe-S protein